MALAVFGTAHLFATVPGEESVQLLQAALAQGFTRFDTAPSYGFGRCEPALGRVLAGHTPAPVVTTKTGITAVDPPGRAVRGLKAVARRLPGGVQERLRGSGGPAGHGHFGLEEVRASVEQSLRRLGPIGRLMLHEVTPPQITDELLGYLGGLLDRGDVARLGVATSNELTVACTARAPDLLDAVHVAVGPLAAPVMLPATVTLRVGHGVLGPAGADLRRLTAARDGNTELAEQWRVATESTHWDTPDGLAQALVARAATLDLDEVIVATSKLDRLPVLQASVSAAVPLEPRVRSALAALTAEAAEAA